MDLGTTWTAAAVHRDGAASIFPLGQRRAAIPSVVLLREDGEVLTGDAAVRRAISEPERVVREFKRRIGDTTPIIVGGRPHSAEALSARLLEAVLEQVTAREGATPDEVAISHPANWGQYKLGLFENAIRLAGLDPDECLLITEPEAAAITYAAQQRISIGENVCVYDLGGGTFDVAVVRRTPTGFTIIGKPDGIERLGGIDFDAAIYAHVTSALGEHYRNLDPNDPATLTAIARLRQDCIDAKEALSADADTSIPVLLPKHQTHLRLTRAEFESLIRPTLVITLETTSRAIASAGLETSDVNRVLLVGGSSRIPLISQMVQGDLGITTTVDTHPKHAIAIGTAIHELASAELGRPTPASPTIHAPPISPTPSPDAGLRPGKAQRVLSPRLPPPPASTPPGSRPSPMAVPPMAPPAGPPAVPVQPPPAVPPAAPIQQPAAQQPATQPPVAPIHAPTAQRPATPAQPAPPAAPATRSVTPPDRPVPPPPPRRIPPQQPPQQAQTPPPHAPPVPPAPAPAGHPGPPLPPIGDDGLKTSVIDPSAVRGSEAGSVPVPGVPPSQARGGDTRIAPPGTFDFNEQDEHGRNPVTLILIIAVIVLMIGFGAFLLLRPLG